MTIQDIVMDSRYKSEFRGILCDIYRKANGSFKLVTCHVGTRAIDKLTMQEMGLIETEGYQVRLTEIGKNLAGHFLS